MRITYFCAILCYLISSSHALAVKIERPSDSDIELNLSILMRLPEEIQIEILKDLDVKSLLRMSESDRYFYHLISNSKHLQNKIISHAKAYGLYEIDRTLNGHTDSVLSASFSPDGTKIVSSSGDRTVKR